MDRRETAENRYYLVEERKRYRSMVLYRALISVIRELRATWDITNILRTTLKGLGGRS